MKGDSLEVSNDTPMYNPQELHLISQKKLLDNQLISPLTVK